MWRIMEYNENVFMASLKNQLEKIEIHFIWNEVEWIIKSFNAIRKDVNHMMMISKRIRSRAQFFFSSIKKSKFL